MTDDRYEIRGKIGQGGVGAVYRAWDKRLNREVAIKRVLTDAHFENEEEAIAHLLKEATALSSVQHPHIVTIYDAGVDEDGPYVVMELLDGRTIDEMVERGTLVWADFRQVAIQTQEALIAAQDLDLVHRDLKPTNLMVVWLPSGKFQIKVVDFGLAKFSDKPSVQTIDHGDAVFGSIHFMAPEQFERTPLDQRTDMYAMGCLYYFTLTSLYPFSGDTAPQVMTAHLRHQVTPLQELRPDLPAWVCDWVMWHINRGMDDRPANAREALHQFLMSEQNNPAPPEGEKQQPQRPKFVFPGSDAGAKTPTPATPPTADVVTQSATPPPPPPAKVPTQTSPQPIQPPEGQKPSVHTTSQVTASQPVPPAPAPQDPPPPPPQPVIPPPPIAPVTPPPAPAAPVVPAAPPAPAAPATPLLTPANPAVQAPATSALQPAPVQPGAPHAGGVAQPGVPRAAIAQPGAVPAAPAAGAVITGSSTLDKKKKGLSTAAKATMAAVLAIAVLFAGILVMGKLSGNKRATMATKLLAPAKDLTAREVPTSSEEVDFLLGLATDISANKDRQAVYQRLLIAASSDGTDLDARIAAFAANDNNEMISDIRVKLFEVLQGRRSASAVPYLIDHAKTSASAQTAAAALKAVEKIATEKDLGDLVNIIRFTSHSTVRQEAKRAIASVAKRTDGRATLATALKSAYESATSDEVKRSYLELLGSAGGKDAQALVESALKDDDKKNQLAALAALRAWPDDSMFETIIDFAKGQKDDLLRSQAFGTAYSFLKLERGRDEIDLEDMWKMLAREARTTTEKRQIIDGMAKLTDDWAFSVVEFFEEDKDDDVSFRAEKARAHMESRRERIEGVEEEK